MKALVDPDHALANGLAAIRAEFQVPRAHPRDIVEAAQGAARRAPATHADRTDLPFVTLDPASSTDLDQAFCIEAIGQDLLLRYAIADVDWFAEPGGVIDAEARRRGATLYLPDGKAGLYPPVLGEDAASLLPTGPRPAIIFVVRVAPDGGVRLDGAERAIIKSRAKLAYDTVRASDLPPAFETLARRIEEAELSRGAVRVDPPEQQVEVLPGGGYALSFRPRPVSEERNAALSLATNLAVADTLLAHGAGLFRVMPEPDIESIERLRATAVAIGVEWPPAMPFKIFERALRADDPKQAAMMLAVRRAGSGASYEPYRSGLVPWHAAMNATYAHATAPLRRYADRHVLMAALAIANGRPISDSDVQLFETLPAVMAKAAARQGQIDRAVLDLAEAVLLRGCKGHVFAATVIDTDGRHGRIQLRDVPVIARVSGEAVAPGEAITVRLRTVDPAKRRTEFDLA